MVKTHHLTGESPRGDFQISFFFCHPNITILHFPEGFILSPPAWNSDLKILQIPTNVNPSFSPNNSSRWARFLLTNTTLSTPVVFCYFFICFRNKSDFLPPPSPTHTHLLFLDQLLEGIKVGFKTEFLWLLFKGNESCWPDVEIAAAAVCSQNPKAN